MHADSLDQFSYHRHQNLKPEKRCFSGENHQNVFYSEQHDNKNNENYRPNISEA